MQEKNSNINNNDIDNEIDFTEIFNILWDGKWIIISLTSLISILGVLYSLSLPNIYTSKATLAPVNPSNSISGAIGGYSGLAGLAGISLPTGSDNGNTAKALEKITTLSFFEDNILPNIFLPNLMAVKTWDSGTNSLTYNDSIYIVDNDTWTIKPSAQQGYKVFSSQLRLIEDKKSGFVNISIKHKSPFIAKQWVDLVIDEVNAFYREKDKAESERAVSFLNQQIAMTGLSEIKQVLAQLLQEETKKLMLIEANEYFVFDYIDPPAVMEKKSEPRRSFICMLIAVLGGILSILLVLIRYYFFKKKLA